MSIEVLLKALQPNLTIVAALFGFTLLFVKLFWFFLSYEKTLRDENFTRLSDLLDNQLEIQIYQPLQEEIEKNIDLGYRYALSLVYRKRFNPEISQYEYIINDAAEIKEVMEKDISEIVRDISGQNIASKTGQDLFIYLEKRYEKTSGQIRRYNLTKEFCQKTWVSCVILAILSAIGIAVFITDDTMDIVCNFWAFASIVTLLFGMHSFSFLFYHRALLIKAWEQLKLHGEQ